MLSEIRIDGLGVISEATAEFHPGFTALTGETGAGKTMVVTSLHLLGGARADANRIRTDMSRAVVEGRFTTDELPTEVRAEVDEALESAGDDRDEDGSVIAVRTVTRDGRSRAHLGGRGVPIGVLSQFTSQLLTVHGQNDQLHLLRADKQREALDHYAVDAIGPLLDKYQSAHRKWGTARAELASRRSRSRELALETDQLQFGLDEIRAVNPVPGEDEEIAGEVRRLGDLDLLRETAEYAHDALAGESAYALAGDAAGISGLASMAQSKVESVDDPALREFIPRLEELVVLSRDLAGDLGGYLATLPTDSRALDDLLRRQSDLKPLTRKYAADIDGVIAWAEAAEQRLGTIDVSADALAELAEKVDKLAAQTATAAKALHRARTRGAKGLAEAVTAELAGLAMGKSRLEVAVAMVEASDSDEWHLEVDGTLVHAGPHGVDAVEMQLGAHPSAPALPIGKSASGGELSRLMLALEVVLAGRDSGGTLVFDEVDAGVGGRAAVEIGKRLAQLSRTHQVIVVTHLPQVAAFADTHLVIGKQDGDTGMVSDVHQLTDSERVQELARMLAGLDDTETGRAHAEELLAKAGAARAR